MSPGIACVGAGSECKASGAQGEGDLLEVRACATEALAHHEADDLEEGHAEAHYSSPVGSAMPKHATPLLVEVTSKSSRLDKSP